MNALRASLLALAALVAGAVPAPAQPRFDDFPTGFLRPGAGGMPPEAWNGTSLATAKRLVSVGRPDEIAATVSDSYLASSAG